MDRIVGPDGSRRIQTDRLDDHWDDQSASDKESDAGPGSRPAACLPPSSAVRYLTEVGAKGGERGRSIGLYRLDVGGLGGLPFGVLEH